GGGNGGGGGVGATPGPADSAAAATTANPSAVCIFCCMVSSLFSVPDVFHHPFRADLGSVDVARRIGGDALGGARAFDFFDRVGNERRHHAGLGAANPDAAFPAVVIGGDRFRFGVGDIDRVIAIDEYRARPAELETLVEEHSILIEDLDAVVVAVADEQPTLRIHGDRMRNIELAACRPFLSPGLDECAVLRELHDPGIRIAAMAV